MSLIARAALGLFLVLAITSVMTRPALAGDEATEALLTEIRRATAPVKAFRSRFVQERRLSLFAEPVIFHGSLTVVRPDKLRWEFVSPVPSALIFNGRSGMRCTDQAPPSRFDLDSDPIMRTVAEQLWLWLGGDYGALGDSYQVRAEGKALLIRPRDEKTREYVEQITISFEPRAMQPERVVIDEPGGDATELRFFDNQQEGDIDPALFTQCQTP